MDTITKVVKKIIYYGHEMHESLRTYFLLSKHSKKTIVNRKIQVAFIVQMAEIWDKEEPVYEALIHNPLFGVSLLVVPPYDMSKQILTLDYSNNYFLEKYKDIAIKAYDNNRWINIIGKYDYVFYQRPYDHYLPTHFQSKNVVGHSKCCYIPYGFSGADIFNGRNTNKRFFRNMYFCFLESDYMVSLLRKKFHFSRAKHHIINLGYPALAPYFRISSKNTYNSILWTPRWSFDEKLGGSTFLKNKNILLKISKMINDCDLVFRPHPLLFGEISSKNLMTQGEIDEYYKNLSESGVRYDYGEPIYTAIKNADILITDFSTIIIQFFITGKPIIYCEGGIKLNELYSKMSEGFYIAHNEKEILDIVLMLHRGYDYLFSKRRKIIDEYLNNHDDSPSRIVEALVKDSIRVT